MEQDDFFIVEDDKDPATVASFPATVTREDVKTFFEEAIALLWDVTSTLNDYFELATTG